LVLGGIVMLDQSEFGIFQLEQEFQQVRATIGVQWQGIEFVVEDITDEAAMLRVFMQHRPAVVFHAAAYKHVPLMEGNPQAAVRNNVFGTRVVVDLADRFQVERFVMISTDKAVRPTNVMGATKLIAEEYLAAVGAAIPNPLHYRSLRKCAELGRECCPDLSPTDRRRWPRHRDGP
jgi:FlaA1/EpsC-like NDP-sugar epimerase